MVRFFKQNIDLSYLKANVSSYRNGERSTSFAFEESDDKKIILTLPRIIGTTAVTLLLYSESGEQLSRIPCNWVGISRASDVYTISLNKKLNSMGLFYFDFELDSLYGTLYLYKKEHVTCGVSFSERNERFQLSVSNFEFEEPSYLYGGIIYQVFVDRFSSGGKVIKKKNGIYPKDWSKIPEYPEYPGAPLKNNTFFGGNLIGVAKKLEYLKSLGVSAIYLTPIFESASNHKYDTANYMSVDPAFGGDRALSKLIKKADALDIKIILDGVFNHTGADSIYFNKFGTYNSVGAYNSKESPYYDWYDFQSYPETYTTWWGIQILPKINTTVKSCKDFISGAGGVIEKYMKMGISGFRLDVVDELSDDFIREIKLRQNESNKTSVLYGEVWEDASNKIAYRKRKTYYNGCELDGVMNYPLRRGIIDFVNAIGADSLRYALTEIYDNAPKRIADLQMNLLGTHDTERILTVLGGDSAIGHSNDELRLMRMTQKERIIAKRKLILAYTILATVPGVPMIYYGDEAGVEGYSDPFNRLPFPWGEEDADLTYAYKKIGTVRRNATVYKKGKFRLLYLDNNILAFARIGRKFAYVTIANSSEKDYKIEFDSLSTSLIDSKILKSHMLSHESASIYKCNITDNIIIAESST